MMNPSVAASAFVAILVGFGASVAIVLAAAEAVGADAVAAHSWIAVGCAAMASTSAYLSFRHRAPIVTAWSTAGAALIAASEGVSLDEAAGAFMAVGAMIVATGAIRPLGRLVAALPASIASAMLAGVLMGFVAGGFAEIADAPVLTLAMLLAFAATRVFSPSWAAIAALGAGVAIGGATTPEMALPAFSVPSFALVAPAFDPAVVLGLGLPLYLVTMASQNLPGAAVLRANGFEPPMGSALGVTGAASILSAFFGAHTNSLASITASICASEDAHPDPAKRWTGGLVYGFGYLVLVLLCGPLIALFQAFPSSFLTMLAALALTGPLASSLHGALAEPEQRFAAITTFAVTASGLAIAGVGAAFWGLVAGVAVLGLERALGAAARREPS